MKDLNRVVLCMGSNLNRESKIEEAAALLRLYFDSICFSEAVYTESVGEGSLSGPFLNQVAIAYTPYTPIEIHVGLKQMEYALGRRPEDKIRGLIPIDIDLLQWNGQILKEEDLKRSYIKESLDTLLSEHRNPNL